MNVLKKSFIAAAVAATLLASVSAHAVTVTFDFQLATDGSGKTSNLAGVNSNNTTTNSNIFIETFDRADGVAGITDYNGGDAGGIVNVRSAGGGFNTLNPATDLTILNSIGIQKGTFPGVGAAPADNSTFYAYGPGPEDGLAARVRVDYATTLAFFPGVAINYLGLYYGSVDTYNEIAFFNSDGNLLTGGVGSLLEDGIISGSEILASQGGITGNQFLAGSNAYVNFFFDAGEEFTAFEFRTSQIAFEVDNVVVGLSNRDVPEPASLALIGLGLLGVAGMRRKAKA